MSQHAQQPPVFLTAATLSIFVYVMALFAYSSGQFLAPHLWTVWAGREQILEMATRSWAQPGWHGPITFLVFVQDLFILYTVPILWMVLVLYVLLETFRITCVVWLILLRVLSQNYIIKSPYIMLGVWNFISQFLIPVVKYGRPALMILLIALMLVTGELLLLPSQLLDALLPGLHEQLMQLWWQA